MYHFQREPAPWESPFSLREPPALLASRFPSVLLVFAAQRELLVSGQRLGQQKVRLAAPGRAFKVTTIAEPELPYFKTHARRFLQHTTLDSIHWINITRKIVRFQTFEK